MIAVNTIHSLSYNIKEREKFCDLYEALSKEIQALADKYDAILETLSDEEYDDTLKQYESERDSLYDKRHNAWINAFAAQFPTKKNEWFTNVINKFIGDGKANGEYFYISAKQYEYFSRYCRHEDEEAWRSFETYCRCCDCLITLSRPKYGGHRMKITQLAQA